MIAKIIMKDVYKRQVYKNEGLANKDLAKFENQIHNLADKWDRD